MENTHKSLRLLTGFAIGSAIGAAVTLLVAPASGEETRRKIKAEVADAQMKTMTAIEDVQNKARNMVEEVKEDVQQRAIRLKGVARKVSDEQNTSLEQGVKEAREAFES